MIWYNRHLIIELQFINEVPVILSRFNIYSHAGLEFRGEFALVAFTG
jgi:hypothetical protein